MLAFFFLSRSYCLHQQLIAVEIFKEQHLQDVTLFLLFLVFNCSCLTATYMDIYGYF